jgi:hypothetical protein
MRTKGLEVEEAGEVEVGGEAVEVGLGEDLHGAL